MSLRRRMCTVAAGAAAAPFVLVMLPAGVANAHGYVSDPPSRQAQCADGTVECGPIQWEPQSVEGPKGLDMCSGGNARFAELDNDHHGWEVTDVASTVEFSWTKTAAHSTRDWQYFIDGDLVAEFDGGNEQPPFSVDHTVDLSDYSGEHTVLAVWNIADTANAFYACTDVNIT
ncbi:lytic polysaccharide monooxygenase [Lipingzhangella sp. LS1_29]|uniref:Lytic polysaccharide monooxygenase n=1 Tax=Lipingzhangella rawalii TaxID=2055835 RepID=A0ABU2H339_9ACTN|nr:lytic polysaccharide monooxygenase [Lipingzhangella rawalii]MDS1269044.1 lytic polysaccharide monooxygenase [Lipingzhangella rawalii]